MLVIAWKSKKESQASPPWLSYRSDNFFELKWVWDYEERDVILRAVECTRCGFQLNPDSTAMFASRVSFHCNNCGRTVPVEGQSWQELQSVVRRRIELNLRNRTYPNSGG